MVFPSILSIHQAISSMFLLFLLLPMVVVQAKGPSRDNKLFIECAVRAPKGQQEPETVVSHATVANNRILFFGLGGNLYMGNNELKEVCKEDKEFAGSSKSAPTTKQGAVEKCESGGGLTLKGGKEMKFTSKKHEDYEQCYAGNYELFECTKQACGKEKLVLVEKTGEADAKSYAFVHGGKMLVKEVTFAELKTTDQMECVKKACAADSVPMVHEVLRWKKVAKSEKKAEDKGKYKVYKECAVKRKRAGNGDIGGTRMETLMAHVKMDKQVLFFGMGGNLYAGDSILANECGEDKYFTKSKVSATQATLLGCHKAFDVKGKKGSAKLTLRRRKAPKNGIGMEQVQMEVKSNKNAKGSQCHVEHGKGEQFDIYKCPKEECGGHERVLLIKKKANAKNKLISNGNLMVEEVLFADTTPKQWQCVQQICGSTARIPAVEAVKRKLDKSAKGKEEENKQQLDNKQNATEAEGQNGKNGPRNKKRRGRKPSEGGGSKSAVGEQPKAPQNSAAGGAAKAA